MKIGVIVPDRGDRPEFLEQFKRYMDAQTLQPDHIFLVNHKPINEDIDIIPRYRIGYKSATDAGCDIVFLCENDDWYSPNYIEKMVAAWHDNNRPLLLTISNSYYYHITGKWFNIALPSANTFLLKTGLNINWGSDNYPYVDVTILGQMPRKYWSPSEPLCIGIKHGRGLVGGGCHNEDNERYTEQDHNGDWLRKIVGAENWEFYRNLQKFKTFSNPELGVLYKPKTK
jgi:glycosyltransferase involved in cell wall biosynthesis